MEAFLHGLLQRFLPEGCDAEFHIHNGKQDLLQKLEGRLRGFSYGLTAEHRIIVVDDRDDDC